MAPLHRVLEQIRKGDLVVVWKLDRLSRSLRDHILTMDKIAAAHRGFRSLTESVVTTTPARRTLMQILGAFAESERSMIHQRARRLDAVPSQGGA